MKYMGKIFRKIDELVLYHLNLRIPDSLEQTVSSCLSFETVLARTQINVGKTAVSTLTASGEHPIWIDSLDETLETRVCIRRSPNPTAPLIIYHHGLNEYPYTSSWRRIFANLDAQYHLVCVQAPFHDNLVDPINKGWATVDRMYQLFSGSLRMVEMMKRCFEQAGSPETILVGLSWGGLVMMLYEGVFQDTAYIVPMMSSPNLAQVLIDSADLFNREVSVPRSQIYELMDFTNYFNRVGLEKMHPLLGQYDGFFRFESHVSVYDKRPLKTIPRGHLSTIWPGRLLRKHVLNVLEEMSESRVKVVGD